MEPCFGWGGETGTFVSGDKGDWTTESALWAMRHRAAELHGPGVSPMGEGQT